MTVRVIGHDHVSTFVPDIGEGIAWYTRHLGFELVDRWDNAESGMEWAHLATGNVRLELVHFPPAVASNGPRHGYHHLAVVVEDCSKAIDELRANGVEIFMGPTYFDRHDIDWAFVHDHAGNVIELLSYRGKQTWPQ